MTTPVTAYPRCQWRFRPWLGGLLVWLAAAVAQAQPVIFTNFNSTGGLTLTSSTTATTTADGKVLRLVQSGASSDTGGAFSTTQLSVTTGFSTAFDFRLTNRAGSSDGTAIGADGFVFVIQKVGVAALGASGEGIGFLNIGAASIGVEFDTFNNGASRNDPSSNHLGINTAGSVSSVATQTIATDFDNGTKWSAWIDYNGSILEVRVSTNGIRPTSPSLSYSITSANFASLLNNSTTGFVGFTAATGGASENIDIVAWTFSDSFIAGGVTAGMAIPEPSTYALLALGLGLVVLLQRRRTRNAR